VIATDPPSATSIAELGTTGSNPRRFDRIAPTMSFRPCRADPWMSASVEEGAHPMLSLVATSMLDAHLLPGTLAG
jgi:hypothetical protein